MGTYTYKRKPLSIEDQDRLINACENQNEKLLIIGILETGMRVSEFCNLTRQNFRWQEGVIILEGKGGRFGKMSKTRVIPLTNRARELFEKFFTWNDKIPFGPRMAQKMVKKVADRANIIANVTPHILRHTFAVRCIEKGISTRSLQAVLGHDHLSTTEIYLNISPETVKKEFREKW
jgi:integrase/recombinase XerD